MHEECISQEAYHYCTTTTIPECTKNALYGKFYELFGMIQVKHHPLHTLARLIVGQ